MSFVPPIFRSSFGGERMAQRNPIVLVIQQNPMGGSKTEIHRGEAFEVPHIGDHVCFHEKCFQVYRIERPIGCLNFQAVVYVDDSIS